MSAAKLKWAFIFSDIVNYEANHLHDGQLLSEECDRLITKHPLLGRAAILVVGFLLTLHLSNTIPEDYDIVATGFWRKRFNH